MDNILDIFYEHSKNDKLLTREAIKKILDIILNELNLENKITYSLSTDEIFDISNIWNINVLAEFDMDSIIYIYYLELLKSINKKKYRTKFDKNYNLTDNDMSFKKNILILETIFHEIEHVKQLEIVKDIYSDTIEAIIYRYEYDFFYSELEEEYESNISYYLNVFKQNIIELTTYNISFMERMANINSFKEMYNLLYKLGNNYSNLYNIEKDILDDYIIKYYSTDLNGPTTKFINKIGYMEEFYECNYPNIIDKMSLEERLKYGFKITNEEYKKKVKK